MQWMRDFLSNNKDAVDALLKILEIIGIPSILGGVGWLIQRWWKKRLRIDVKVFELITDPNVLLPKLYSIENDNSPLADHRITYQPRDPNRDIQRELRAALNRSRYLLVTAPTGYGKTREAGVLSQSMMLEGWRVLRIKMGGWLDIPKILPEELNNNRSRVLIFLDDLNGLFSTGKLTQSPRAEQMPFLSQASYHDRLLQVLDTLEGMCTKSEIRVIATARSEAEQWQLLDFDSNDKLWTRFQRIELPQPTDTAIINLLNDSTRQGDLKAKPDEFLAIAHKSDGTYRNVIINLRRLRTQNKTVTKDDFTDTLNGSWREIYEQAAAKHPAVQYIYDAIDILRQAGIGSDLFRIKPMALIIWGGNGFQKLMRRAQIQRALEYLTQETNILRQVEGKLSPSDGQIEAKATKIDWRDYTLVIERLILEQIPDRNLVQANLLFYFGFKCLEAKSKEDALRIWRKIPPRKLSDSFNKFFPFIEAKRIPGAKNTLHHAFEQKPGPYSLYFLLGIMLEMLDRLAEAENVYCKFITENPNDAYAYSKLGDVLRELKRYAEAEEAYRQAISKDPDYADAYSRLGSLLRILERYTEAEEAYRQAITKDLNGIDTALICARLGVVLWKLGRYAESEDFLRQATDKDANDAQSSFNLGVLFKSQKRFDEAKDAYRKAIEINSEDFHPYLGIVSINKQLGKTISSEYLAKARQFMPEDDWYNRACLESICDNFDIAFEYLQKAAQKEYFHPGWAWEDPDLEHIRNDRRFTEIVGPKPENKNSEI